MSRVPVLPLALADDLGTLPYLSLGMVAAYLRVWRDGALDEHYVLERLLPAGPAAFPEDRSLAAIPTRGTVICLFSSYVWNHHRNVAAARRLRHGNPRQLNIIGGPQVPKYPGETEDFLRQHPYLDIAVLGEGEQSCAEVLAALAASGFSRAALATVPGIVFRDGEDIVRTAERTRLKDINVLPSPYLSGEFEPWFEDFDNTILETNRGCPYGCTYCDWGSATLQKVSRFDAARVEAEIDYLAAKRSQAIFIADANFGMLEQDIRIAAALVASRARTGYPQRIYTNFAKNGGRRLMEVIRILHEGGLLPTGIIALQTTDETVLKAIKRDNIKTTSYEKMMEYFNARSIPMASDLMIGLPGQTPESLQRDLQFCFDWKVSANGNYTSMMPNAPMAEPGYRKQHAIVTDRQGMVAATASFTESDLAYMKSLFIAYEFHVRLGILRYYLYYLQLDHGVPAIELLRQWLDAVRDGGPGLPLSLRVYREIFRMERDQGHWGLLGWEQQADFLFADIPAYVREIHQLAQRHYGVSVAPAELQALCLAQDAVMPKLGRDYPFVRELPHDLVAWVRRLKQAPSLHALSAEHRPLGSFGPGRLRATAANKRRQSLRFQHIDGHRDAWELKSPLRFY